MLYNTMQCGAIRCRITASKQRLKGKKVHNFALIFFPNSSSAKASAYSSSRCVRYFFAVGGRFIFNLRFFLGVSIEGFLGSVMRYQR
jgi:hypothetical protein